MPSLSPRDPLHCRLALTLLSSLGLLAGCATSRVAPPAPPPASVVSAEQPTTELVPVARYGRYTLVELVPEPVQRDLLQQAVEVSIPPMLDASVGDAMRHVLLRSGYRLCDAAEAASLYALPLPAAHLRLGPLMLRDALLTLAGPAWELSVDDVTRQVCFSRHGAPTFLSANPPGAATPVPDADRPEEMQP
ncbi:TPA: PilL N-terminal domain-containing protein [Pseudomonas aeruginosa]